MARSFRNPRVSGALFVLVVAAIAVLTQPVASQAPPSDQPQVTFTKDVAPILQRACQRCHRPGQIGPMSLLSYEEARPWARAIKAKTAAREMPPWSIDRTIGIQKFKDDPSLTDAELATLAAWADAGAPRGNPADMPPPVQFAPGDRWTIGEPDLIVQLPVEHVIAADSSDWWGNYESDPIPLKEPRYIRAIEALPSPEAQPVVHHASMSLFYDDSEERTELITYDQGRNGDIFPENTGRLIKPGARVSFGMHYHGYGKEVKDRTAVAFKFYPRGYVPKYVHERSRPPSNDDLDIPAGETNVRFDVFYRLEKPTVITGFQPHMHARGVRQCLTALYPPIAGRRESEILQPQTLSCVNFNFAWQITYNYADDVQPLLPAGTVLQIATYYDNSAKNKFNPDPRNWVGYGPRSSDEMARTHMNYFYIDDDEYQLRMHERRLKQQQGTK